MNSFSEHATEGDAARIIKACVPETGPISLSAAQLLLGSLGEAGKRAVEAIGRAAREDPELSVKKKAIFALSQLPADEGIPLLIEMAETHPQSEIRKRAMFWLGQSGDRRAVDFFEQVLLDR